MASAAPGAPQFRPLQPGDFHKGFLSLLGQLTTVGTVSEASFTERCAEMTASPDYHVTVVEDAATGQIVACGTLLVERKFIHECGKVGHIEDVVVSEAARGQSLGRGLVQELLRIGQAAGCYKVILDCDDKNVGFYEKCGMKRKGAEMAKYFE